jgi:hypothetical protein
MYYTNNNEKYKLVEQNNKVKLYHKANNKYSSGWTFIGIFNNKKLAEIAANKYSS